MNWLFDGITEWIRQFLIDGIMAKFADIFGYVNDQVADIAVQVGQTPAGWNAGVFAMVRNLSETVVLPIAGMILTFVLCYELIQLIIEKNNLQDFDTFNIFKWIFKTFIAVYILTNTFQMDFQDIYRRVYPHQHVQYSHGCIRYGSIGNKRKRGAYHRQHRPRKP